VWYVAQCDDDMVHPFASLSPCVRKPFSFQIVANPPYIDPVLFDGLPRDVRHHEDPCALIAPERGLALIRRLLELVPRLTPCSGTETAGMPRLVVEFGGAAQVADLHALLAHTGWISATTVEEDQFGVPRYFVVRGDGQNSGGFSTEARPQGIR
jgi:methylase of polypeptide subunit release factors